MITLLLVYKFLGYIVALFIALYLERHFTGEITVKNVIVALLLAPMGWWLLWGTLIIILDKNWNYPWLNKRLWILLLVPIMISCAGSNYDREKKHQIKTRLDTYEIQSIRVDDDSEYHIVAINKTTGTVKAINDAISNGYVGEDLTITYSRVIQIPTMYINSDDSQSPDYFTENRPYRILLPMGYKIETFDD